MSTRPAVQRLGEVEQFVLLALVRLGGPAYAVPIREVIAEKAGVELSRASIYIALDRLERKGLLESVFSEPTGKPGGKGRRMFRLRPAGLASLRAARRAVDRLAADTVFAKGSS
jgi:DNA-binding PadR family transcriptional regulator